MFAHSDSFTKIGFSKKPRSPTKGWIGEFLAPNGSEEIEDCTAFWMILGTFRRFLDQPEKPFM
jgi:hypothetical protein